MGSRSGAGAGIGTCGAARDCCLSGTTSIGSSGTSPTGPCSFWEQGRIRINAFLDLQGTIVFLPWSAPDSLFHSGSLSAVSFQECPYPLDSTRQHRPYTSFFFASASLRQPHLLHLANQQLQPSLPKTPRTNRAHFFSIFHFPSHLYFFFSS